MGYKICLIEDDEILGEALSERFDMEGIECSWHQDGASALKALAAPCCHLVVSDIQLPDMTGEELFDRLLKRGGAIPPFLFITGYGAVDQAVRLLKKGAEDYLTKPFEVKQLLQRIETICQRVTPVGQAPIALGGSPGMLAIEQTLPRIARNDTTVLITGESGVGKEYVARALHANGNKPTAPFVAVNCGAIPEGLIEAELFGYRKGAFTGASSDRKGLFEQANGGTLFLDEIGDMPTHMQVKLLRAIQERQVQRIGSETPIPVDIRLVCATHRDLQRMVETGEFREDLYYRINVVNIKVPPLRERPEDILWHARRFLDQSEARFTIDPRAEQALLAYPWPGNIRELRNNIERAIVLSPSQTLTPELLFGEEWQKLLVPVQRDHATLASYIQECERNYIQGVLAEHEGRIADSARALGISRKTLWDKMKKLELSDT